MKRAGDLLSDFFKDHFDPVSLENGRMTAGLFSSWAETAKAANMTVAADHSRIREFEHKVLVIEAEHPGWVQLLQTKQSQLLHCVQGRFPELDIQGISFCLSSEQISSLPVPETSPAPENTSPVTELNEATPALDPQENEALYKPIKELKRVLQKRNRN